MLKAKLILSGVALMAVVGAAFAFKAARQPHILYEVDTTNPVATARICTKQTLVFYSTTTTSPTAITKTNLPYFTTTVNSTTCPTVSLFDAL